MEEKLYLTDGCHFEIQRYLNGAKYLSLEYVERTQDYCHSDTETSVDISKDKAKEIIDFLQSYIGN